MVIPEGHFLHGMHYDTIHKLYDIDVHGGLTFSSSSIIGAPDSVKDTDWIVGFDTAHYNDSLENWPDRESVLKETQRLKIS